VLCEDAAAYRSGMRDDGYRALAAGLRRWGDLPDAELARARAVFRPVHRPARTLLQRAGEPADRVWFLVSGLTRVFSTGADGVERTTAFRAEGELVCAYAAALSGTPSRTSIETIEACDLLVAPRVAFDDLSRGHPAWPRLLAVLTERRYVDVEERTRDLLTSDATTRYRHFLRDEPALARRLTQKQIAGYVGVTPESLSRIRATLLA
jgi:CRP-like cAMP-binding protein